MIANFNPLFLKVSKTFSYQIIGVISSFAFNIFFARNTETEIFGIFTLAISWLSILSIFNKIGADTGSIKFLPQLEANNKLQKSFITILIKHVSILGIAIVFVSYLLSKAIFLKNLSHNYLILIFSIIIILPFRSVLDVLNSWHQYYHNYELSILPRTVGIPVLTILIYSVLTYNYPANNTLLFYSYPISIILVVLISSYFLFKLLLSPNLGDQQIVTTQYPFELKQFYTVSLVLSIVSGLHYIYQEMDIIMLSWLSSINNIAIYGIVEKINTLMAFGLASINFVVIPEISKLFNTNKIIDLQNLLIKSSKILFPLAFILLIFILLTGRLLLNIFGEQYVVGASALYILSIGQFFSIVTGPVGAVLSMTNNQIVLLNITIISLILNLVLNLILIPYYGINGAALSTAISTIFRNFTCAYYVKKILKIKPTILY